METESQNRGASARAKKRDICLDFSKSDGAASFRVLSQWTVAALLLLSLLGGAQAGWIDPETPEEAHATTAYTVHMPPKPTPSPTILYNDDYYFDDDLIYHRPGSSNSNKNNNNSTNHGEPRRWKPTKAPTRQPTAAPTVYTAAPSSAPTGTPGAYRLVFSDEFNTPYRTFEDGTDPRWTTLEKNDYTNNALHYYSQKNAFTNDKGELVIQTEAADTEIVGFDDVKRKKTHVTKHFRSAMIQSWNKFCFTGGIIEAEVALPGKSDIGGLWPAFWLLGNLARHTYVGSSAHIWPWSETGCTKKSQDSQLISGCHNIAHYGMKNGVGRGSPEMDIFEVQPGNVKANHGVFWEMPVGQPFMSASYQVAPGRAVNRPGNAYWPGPGQWYQGLIGGANTSLNIQFYGNYNHFKGDYDPSVSDYWSDALSFNRQLNQSHFQERHVYRLEWQPPTEDNLGYLHWFLDGKLVLAIPGKSLNDTGLGSEISSEPSYILFNTAISSEWGFPKECPANCPCKEYDCYSTDFRKICGFSEGFCTMIKNERPQMRVNWVRVYQNPDDPVQKVGCSTPERPTRQWIAAHESLYKTEKDVHPLKGIQKGRGECDPGMTGEIPAACGGPERGRCTQGKVCECKVGWTGPHCLANRGFDDILWDAPDKITDVGFEPPLAYTSRFLIVALALLISLFVISIRWKKRMEQWTPIPDVKMTSHG